MELKDLAGRLGYAALFVLLLPALAVGWARGLRGLSLPVFGTPLAGGLAAVAGLALMGAAAIGLWRHGGGLPMSAYPPRRLVSGGAYRIFADPIYVGAVALAFGVSLAARSAAGLWVVTPVLAMACAAWVLGYERDRTRRLYGTVAQPRLRLPPAGDAPPAAADRVSVYTLVFLPWLAAYMAVETLGVPPDAVEAYMDWERALPVVPWTELLYAFTYPFVLAVPFVAARRSDLRQFALRGLVATALIVPLYLLVPVIATAKPVPGEGLWQGLLRWERQSDQPVTALPAFHVVWPSLAAIVFGRRWPRAAWLWWSLVAAIAGSCVTTGMHAVLDVAAGFAAAALVIHAGKAWEALRRLTEWTANSWHEWTLGPVRFINHGVYAALGAGAGLTVLFWLGGARLSTWSAFLVVAAIAGAGIWAQVIEGSPRLLRPYGYFGSVAAALLVSLMAGWSGADGWRLLAACAIAASVTQPLGRIRCLVQGCCHGRPAPPGVGIAYSHPRSRVVVLAGLGGVPVHATPLYSALWTLVVGTVLLRLWFLQAPEQFIVGAYFILIGLGRFVEEHYRGEPQTPSMAGLRLYQWLAIAFVVLGAMLSTLGAAPAPAPEPVPARMLAAVGLATLLAFVAYGADLPRSNRRFSRLV